MTRAETARVALRLADALGLIAEETRREDRLEVLIDGSKADAAELCAVLVFARGHFDYPVPGPSQITYRLSVDAMTADEIERASDTWRAWGERLRVEAEATPIGTRCLAVAPDAQDGRCPSCGRPRATDDARRAYVARTDVHAQRVCHG